MSPRAARAARLVAHLRGAGGALTLFAAGPRAPSAGHAAGTRLHAAASTRAAHLHIAHRAAAAAAAGAFVSPGAAVADLTLHPAVHARDHARRVSVGAVAVARGGARRPTTIEAALDPCAAGGAAWPLRHSADARARVVAVLARRDTVAIDVALGHAVSVFADVLVGALRIAADGGRRIDVLGAAIEAIEGVALPSNVTALGAACQQREGAEQ